MTRDGYIAVLFMIVLIVGIAIAAIKKPRAQDCEYGAFGCGHQEQHHLYQGWKTKQNGSCCNGDDCRPVRARVEWDGSWSVWIPEFRRWVPVPAFAVGEPDRFGDGRSHVCSSRPVVGLPVFHIHCFSPTGSKS